MGIETVRVNAQVVHMNLCQYYSIFGHWETLVDTRD